MSHPLRYGVNPAEETNSGVPKEMPVGAVKPPSLQEMVARMVHNHLNNTSVEEKETWEEANDFEPEEWEDLLPLSQYEMTDTLEEPLDPGYDPSKEPPQTQQEAPQEEISTREGPSPQSKEETPSGASE